MGLRAFWLNLGWLVMLVVTFAIPLALDAAGRLTYFTSLTIWGIPILYLWPSFNMLTAAGTGRRRRALRWTVGAIVGPNLVAPSRTLAASIGLPELAGPYLMPIVFVGLASFLSFALLRPDPLELADSSAVAQPDDADPDSLALVIRRPPVLAAIVALVVGQFVMVLIMTMTPLHMTTHGHDLGAVGIVISAHTFGMFALAPISGRLTDRFGSIPVIYAGTAILVISGLLAAAAPPDAQLLLLVALFLLGWGWNLGFVAGSAMLTGGVSVTERTRVQGLADGLIWGTAAIASLGSGVILGVAGFAALGYISAALVLLPVFVLTVWRGKIPLHAPARSFEPIGD